MGKSALLFVIVSIYSWSMTSSNQSRVLLELEDEQAFYEEKVLAREQALSGFNMVVSDTENDFDNYRSDLLSKAYRDGNFSISAIGASGDTVTVAATGKVGRAEYTIVGEMVQPMIARLGALNIDGPISLVRGIGASYGFTGIDTRPDDLEGTATGEGPNASGIHSVLESAHNEMEDGLRAELVTGGDDGTPGSFTFGTEKTNVDFDELSNTILGLCERPLPHSRCMMLDGDQLFAGNDVFGMPNDPVIMIVDGNATFRGNIQGYGVLYVKGDFKTEVGEPRWEGLIYASTVGGTHELKGQPHIYGALVLRSTFENGVPATNPLEKEELEPLSFTVRGEPSFHYSSLALGRLSFLSSEFTEMLEAGPGEVKLVNVRQASADAQTYNALQ